MLTIFDKVFRMCFEIVKRLFVLVCFPHTSNLPCVFWFHHPTSYSIPLPIQMQVKHTGHILTMSLKAKDFEICFLNQHMEVVYEKQITIPILHVCLNVT